MKIFRYERRLHWSECDPAGIIFFPNYAKWMVDGLNEFLLSEGVDPNRRMDGDTVGGLPVIGLAMKFHDAPELNAMITHEISSSRIGRSSIDFVHRFLRGSACVAEAEETRIWALHRPAAKGGTVAVAVPEFVRIALSASNQ